METPHNTPPEPRTDPTALIVLLGKIVSFVDLYGPEHNMSRSAVAAAYQELLQWLTGDRAAIVLSVVDNDLLVDGETVESKNPLVARFAERLSALNIYGFSLKQGMSEEEFGRLVRLFCVRETRPGAPPFAEAISDGTFQHVAPSRTVLREVDEDEEIVKKAEGTEEEAKEPAGYGDSEVQEIIAFLKGEIAAQDQESLRDPETVASNAEKLSELIMQSVAVRQRQGSLDQGESLADLVVGCLRRTYEGLSKGKSARSKTGRKRIERAMVVLEKEVLERLRTFAGDAAQEVSAELEAEVKAIREEINLDNLVSDYLRRRKAAEESEKKLLKLMRSNDASWPGEVGLQQSLLEGGLQIGDWRKLELASGSEAASRGGPATEAGQAGVSMLALALTELTELMDQTSSGQTSEERQQQLNETLERIGREVNHAVEETERKIDSLAEQMDAGEPGAAAVPERAGVRPSRDWALVAEIVQEICQPLTVINCTIDMLSHDRFGTLPEAGRQPLGMAHECTVRMHALAARLIEVCGVPSTLLPQPVMGND